MMVRVRTAWAMIHVALLSANGPRLLGTASIATWSASIDEANEGLNRTIADSRLAPHFSFIGDFSRHYGLFEGCGSVLPFDGGAMETAAATASHAATSSTSGSCC